MFKNSYISFSALCKGGCRNGGKCVAPNQCSCKKGYEGKNCKKGKKWKKNKIKKKNPCIQKRIFKIDIRFASNCWTVRQIHKYASANTQIQNGDKDDDLHCC